jgi:hypothetical protein
MLKRMAASIVAVGAVAVVWAGSAAGATGSQRFTVSGSDNGGHVYASGPISGSGRDIVMGQNADKFVFPNGSVIVSHHATSMNDNFDPRSCMDRFTESGTYSLSNGTGAYKGVTGSGTYTAKGVARGTRTATGCSMQAKSRYLVNASGWTKLP